jgi:hypothetical protein
MKKLTICSPSFTPDNSVLVTNENFAQFIEETDGQFHTGLADLAGERIINFAKNCSLEFVDTGFNPNDRLATGCLLNYLHHNNHIKNFSASEPSKFLSRDVTTRPDSPCIWVYGCSFSLGYGVLPTEKYASIISESLSLPVILIAAQSASTRWELRHLMASNFQPGDIVIWQFAPIDRFTIKEPNIDPVETALKNTRKEFFFAAKDEQIIFDHLSLVNYGVAYLRSRNVRFKMIQHENQKNSLRMLSEYTKYPEFVYIPNWFTDFGDDNAHPGKMSHQTVANCLVDSLEYKL